MTIQADNVMAIRLILIILLFSCPLWSKAQDVSAVDSIWAEPVDSLQPLPAMTDTVTVAKKENFLKAFIRQLLGGNKDKTFEKTIDFSGAIAP